MSKVENINIGVGAGYSGDPIIIHLLEGPAPEPQKTNQPKNIKVIGDINVPVKFSKGMQINEGAEIFSTDILVTYSDNPKGPYIELQLSPDKSISHYVRGELNMNPDLKAFRFNEAGAFTNKTFAEMIMKHPHCFANKGEAKTLRKALQNYQARFNTIVKKADDNQGNTEDMIKTEFDKVGSGIPNTINLKMPLFDGGEDVEFSAKVEIDVQMNTGKPEARFAFFTEELELAQREGAKEIVNGQIEILSKNFTCIRINNS